MLRGRDNGKGAYRIFQKNRTVSDLSIVRIFDMGDECSRIVCEHSWSFEMYFIFHRVVMTSLPQISNYIQGLGW